MQLWKFCWLLAVVQLEKLCRAVPATCLSTLATFLPLERLSDRSECNSRSRSSLAVQLNMVYRSLVLKQL
jgi:hypothetical protein